MFFFGTLLHGGMASCPPGSPALSAEVDEESTLASPARIEIFSSYPNSACCLTNAKRSVLVHYKGIFGVAGQPLLRRQR